MKTRHYTLQQILDDRTALAVVARQVNKGAVVVYPTETIYGIGGIATDDMVRGRIFEAKQRPEKNPLILIASRPEEFDYLKLDFPSAAHRLTERFWPGNLTLVLNVRGTDETVAIRVSDHPFIKSLLALVRAPLFSTSANVSGKAYNPDPKSIAQTFDGKVDYFIDAGWLVPRSPSTVVRATPDNIVVMIREGAVSTTEIQTVVARVY